MSTHPTEALVTRPSAVPYRHHDHFFLSLVSVPGTLIRCRANKPLPVTRPPPSDQPVALPLRSTLPHPKATRRAGLRDGNGARTRSFRVRGASGFAGRRAVRPGDARSPALGPAARPPPSDSGGGAGPDKSGGGAGPAVPVPAPVPGVASKASDPRPCGWTGITTPSHVLGAAPGFLPSHRSQNRLRAGRMAASRRRTEVPP